MRARHQSGAMADSSKESYFSVRPRLPGLRAAAPSRGQPRRGPVQAPALHLGLLTLLPSAAPYFARHTPARGAPVRAAALAAGSSPAEETAAGASGALHWLRSPLDKEIFSLAVPALFRSALCAAPARRSPAPSTSPRHVSGLNQSSSRRRAAC